MLNKVYAVEEFDGESFHVLDVFSTEDKAKEFIKYEEEQGYYGSMNCTEYEVK
ncbi:MAG: DUF7336 domain-containing protein [Clostridium sp.]|uniref:DUF7336 domain-containing protein n=1 Tax=Clostridium sp. TaxID=1506 RepID=UPI003EE5F5F4